MGPKGISVALIASIAGTAAGFILLASLLSASSSLPTSIHSSEAEAARMPLNVKEVFKDRQRGDDALGGSTYFRMDEAFVDDENHCEFCIALEYKPGPRGKAIVSFARGTDLDLSEAKKLTFAARGERGGETLKVYAAGIKVKESPTKDDKARAAEKELIKGAKFSVAKKVTLTKDWQWYEIDLQNVNLSKVKHGFAFEVLKGKGNEKQVAYLDSIQYTNRN